MKVISLLGNEDEYNSLPSSIFVKVYLSDLVAGKKYFEVNGVTIKKESNLIVEVREFDDENHLESLLKNMNSAHFYQITLYKKIPASLLAKYSTKYQVLSFPRVMYDQAELKLLNSGCMISYINDKITEIYPENLMEKAVELLGNQSDQGIFEFKNFIRRNTSILTDPAATVLTEAIASNNTDAIKFLIDEGMKLNPSYIRKPSFFSSSYLFSVSAFNLVTSSDEIFRYYIRTHIKTFADVESMFDLLAQFSKNKSQSANSILTSNYSPNNIKGKIAIFLDLFGVFILNANTKTERKILSSYRNLASESSNVSVGL